MLNSILNNLFNWWSRIDKISFFIIILMLSLSTILILSASSQSNNQLIKELSISLVRKQLIFSIIVFLCIYVFSNIQDYDLRFLSVIFYFLIYLSLLYILFNGIDVKGAKRWLSIFGIRLQTSELIKPFFIILNAYIISLMSQHQSSRLFLLSILFLVFTILPIFIQPDLGMTLILCIVWASQIFISGISISFLFSVGLLFIIFITLVGYFVFPHVLQRFDCILNISSCYQINKSIKAFSTSSFSGAGIFNGRIVDYLPESHTDFIISVAAEELGLGLTILIIALNTIIIIRFLLSSYYQDNIFRKVSIYGLSILFILQVYLNLGVNIGLVPPTGLTFPLLSYGRSSLLSNGIILGMLLGLSSHRKHAKPLIIN